MVAALRAMLRARASTAFDDDDSTSLRNARIGTAWASARFADPAKWPSSSSSNHTERPCLETIGHHRIGGGQTVRSTKRYVSAAGRA